MAYSSEGSANATSVQTQPVKMPTDETFPSERGSTLESFISTYPLAPKHDKATELTSSQDGLPATSSTPAAAVLSTTISGDVAHSELPSQASTTKYGEESSAGASDTAGIAEVIADTDTADVAGQQVLTEQPGAPDVNEPTSAESFTPWKGNDSALNQLETLQAVSDVTESNASLGFPHISSEGFTSVALEVTTTLPASTVGPAANEPAAPHTPAISAEEVMTSPHGEQTTTEKSSVLAALPPETQKQGSSENSTVSTGFQYVSSEGLISVASMPPRSPTHEFRLVFNTSAEFSWEQVEALEMRIHLFSNDSTCPQHFARTAFTLGPPHELSWTDPSANTSWCDRGAVDTLLRAMRSHTGHPTPEVTRAFYPEFKVVAVELHYRGACTDRRGITSFPVAATAIGVGLAAALVAGLVLWSVLRLLPPRSRKLNVTSRPPPGTPHESICLKQRRPVLLAGENRAGSTNGTPSKSPHTKPNPPFVVDTDFCYINPNFLEVVKQSPPPPPPYRKSLERRSLEAVLPAAPPPRPPHRPHTTIGSQAPAEHDGSSSSGVESDAQPSGEAKSNESS
ncbi:hypothetical protein HPB50_007638 [Hyalomma asiaticum]|uniref:Uncharacterized protein n=1 Tax=Hyalomma asiaticum TaxID=266040 RepID=A0ACB7RYG6_HYAAI|nr:hypothetical protein HPB50_007638 [Hyalomma asiaticum]